MVPRATGRCATRSPPGGRSPDSSGLTAWDHVRIATRLPYGYGKDRQRPQILALTTPKRTPVMKKLLKLVEENPAVILRTRHHRAPTPETSTPSTCP